MKTSKEISEAIQNIQVEEEEALAKAAEEQARFDSPEAKAQRAKEYEAYLQKGRQRRKELGLPPDASDDEMYAAMAERDKEKIKRAKESLE